MDCQLSHPLSQHPIALPDVLAVEEKPLRMYENQSMGRPSTSHPWYPLLSQSCSKKVSIIAFPEPHCHGLNLTGVHRPVCQIFLCLRRK